MQCHGATSCAICVMLRLKVLGLPGMAPLWAPVHRDDLKRYLLRKHRLLFSPPSQQ